MRLWHIDLIPYLPKSQLLAQKRECDLIWQEGQYAKHILINYIHDYSIDYFFNYYCQLEHEFIKRGYKFRNKAPYGEYVLEPPYKEHNNEYLTICYWNLREKYLRGQKDFTEEVWNKLDTFYKNHFKK